MKLQLDSHRAYGEVWAARATNPMEWNRLRGFVVDGLGDAAAYQFVQGEASGTYRDIHDRIHRLFVNKLGPHPGPAGCARPLTRLAHHVLLYIWDTLHGYETGADPGSSDFERMEWLARMVTFGSTIPLLTFAYKTGRRQADHTVGSWRVCR